MASCQVKLEEGLLQGKQCTTFYGKKYYSFEGIPYAKPPVGRLRFRNPLPGEPWEGILDATNPGNKAMQSNPYSATPIDGSEDCLYLNIYTPVLPAEKTQKLPVLFFVHGGRLIFGYGNYYTPDYLIKHDVIFVTVNYRLNILGWLCLNILWGLLIMGKNLTNERELYNFLVNVPVEDLIIAFTEAEISRPRSVINAYFLPVVEKEFDGVERFFAEHPRVAIRENRFHKVPVLTAVNSHEAVIFFNENGKVVYENDFYYFIPQFAFIDKDTQKAKKIAEKIRKFYIGNRNADDAVKEKYIQMASDVFFWRDIALFAENVSKFWDQIYVLQFNYTGNMHTRVMKSINMKGATHGDMIQYQFYRKNKMANATEKDIKMVQILSEICCNFAKNGKPTWSEQKVDWLPYTNGQRHTLLVDDEITLAKDYGLDRLNFWIELAKEYNNATSKL